MSAANEDTHEPRTSLRQAIAQFERIHEAWRARFKPQLPGDVVFAVLPRGRRKALGWFWRERWQTNDGRRLPEINICAEQLARSVYDIAETVIHELVHFANYVSGVRDCSSYQYHNEHFKRTAVSVGLVFPAQRHPRFGWAFTQLSEWAREEVARLQLDEGAFAMFRAHEPFGQARAKAKLRRWACARATEDCCPPAWVAAGSSFPAICAACRQAFAAR